MTQRYNRGGGELARIPNRDRAAAEKRYVDTHWGEPLNKIVEHPDPDMPAVLVGMGKLIELHYQHPNDYTKPPYPDEPDCDNTCNVITFPKGCILAFDNTKVQRLYACLTDGAREGVRDQFPFHRNGALTLDEVAYAVGGRQAKYRNPHVRVNTIGLIVHVVYRTLKKGDGLSEYIHRFGEEVGPPPALCADAHGRLWFAGGSYTVLDAGIAD